MRISYVCDRWPYLNIGRDIHFEAGIFSTEDVNLQELIEKNDSFGSVIKFQDAPEVIAAREAQAEADKMQGGFRSDPSQDATLQHAERIGMDAETTAELIEDRKEAVKEETKRKLMPNRRLGRRVRKPKQPDNEWK